MENLGVEMSSFSDLGQLSVYESQNVCDFGDLTSEKYQLGFMELLGVHDQELNPFTLPNSPPPLQFSTTPFSSDITLQSEKVTYEVESLCTDHFLMKPPVTPNSSSISSASSEAVTEEEKKRDKEEKGEENEPKTKRNKRFTSKNTNQKTPKQPRVAFMTKSEIDHLEDGYKWRKYGQKAVKNSPFPRNYYRCTTSWCNVKKRVERSFTDPSIVVTTYEGQHTHPSPIISSPFFGSKAFNGFNSTLSSPFNQLSDNQQDLSCFGTDQYLNKKVNGSDLDDHIMKKSRANHLQVGVDLVKDYGLLQDIVPSHIFN